MNKYRIWSLIILATIVLLGYLAFVTEDPTSKYRLKYGLDISGGTHLVFDADTSALSAGEVGESMRSLRDVIERRVNVFGVSEPLVQIESASFGEVNERLIVELPGVADINEAVEMIGRTPMLEFRLVDPNFVPSLPSDDQESLPEDDLSATLSDGFIDTGLTGALLQRATLQFQGAASGGFGPTQPVVVVDFNREGADLFTRLTTENVGRTLAIFLDGVPVSMPRINEPITGGTAVISGSFSVEEAQTLVRDLNMGALPVPIELSSVQKIGATLGQQVKSGGIMAGVVGLIIVALFMVARYRLPGVISIVALTLYLCLMLWLFKLVPVVLTAAGIAGFILSIAMAIDANILIFERLHEELQDKTKTVDEAIRDGFSRAWLSIRDANLTSLITAVILYWAGTSLVKGFAVTFGLGIIVSMFTAITVTRTVLLATVSERLNPKWLQASFSRLNKK